ncbi:MAG: CRISPR-associated helicase Cas3' [Gemmatimonadaceae bacterium]
MVPRAYAHTLPGRPVHEWEPLEAHLEKVAELCATNASAFGASDWGRTLGWWHDLGKYSRAFQDYLRRSGGDPDAGEEERPRRVDHSTFGAQYATRNLGPHVGRIMAFCLAGHHAGLTDATSDDVVTVSRSLERRLTKEIPDVALPSHVHVPPRLLPPFTPEGLEKGFQVAFFTRILFSCLIDADRIATEAFCDPRRAAQRNRDKPRIGTLSERLGAFLDEKEAQADDTEVNRVRRAVRQKCVEAASFDPGFFSLQVPTGGGKTLASLAFGLQHALQHDLRRVIVALPFTSIVEQSADVFRAALGAVGHGAVVEHHSNIKPSYDTLENQLAAENWDAPVIVTTNVQLYESLFAAATRPCRKLHRIVRSVIILDEAQTIPVELLAPTLAALRELVRHYGCTVVLCTATQPALERRQDFAIGIENVRPIVTEADFMFERLRRVRIESLGVVPDDHLARRLADEHSVLCIVNTRAHASALYDAVAANGAAEECFHLSTLMCAEHRRTMLDKICARLRAGARCRVVSTQLVEAGVDIDFPVVYRAPAGFDSIAQAAGRCNREGKLDRGRVYLFDTEKLPPTGLLRQTAQVARELMGVLWPGGERPDPLAPQAIEAYFRQYYWSQQHSWDRHQVMEALHDRLDRPEMSLKFRTAAEQYRIICDEQIPVLVPYDGTAQALMQEIRAGAKIDYRTIRDAQRYLVGVWPQAFGNLETRGAVVQHESGLWLLVRGELYSAVKGLVTDQQDADSDVWIA